MDLLDQYVFKNTLNVSPNISGIVSFGFVYKNKYCVVCRDTVSGAVLSSVPVDLDISDIISLLDEVII